MIVALIGTATAVAAAIIRLTLGVKLMNEYRVEEYMTDPRARRMYIVANAMPFILAAWAILMAMQTHLWWVVAAAAWLAIVVIWKTWWIVYMRVTGKYRDFYAKAQWR